MILAEHRLSALPFADHLCVAGGASGNYVDRVPGDSLPVQAAHVDDLLGCKPRSGPSCHPGSPLMASVLGKRNPFEVFRGVVELVSVNMIDRQPGFMAWAKRKCHQSMKSFLHALAPSYFPCNFKVAISRLTWRKDSSFSLLHGGMCYPKPSPRIGAFLALNKNPSKAGNVPFNALGLYNAPFFTGARHGFNFG